MCSGFLGCWDQGGGSGTDQEGLSSSVWQLGTVRSWLCGCRDCWAVPAALCPNSCVPASGLQGMFCREMEAEQSPFGTESAINIHNWNIVWNPICWCRYSRGSRGICLNSWRSLIHALGPSASGGGSSVLASCVWLCPKIEEMSKMLFWTFILSQLLQFWAFSPWNFR